MTRDWRPASAPTRTTRNGPGWCVRVCALAMLGIGVACSAAPRVPHARSPALAATRETRAVPPLAGRKSLPGDHRAERAHTGSELVPRTEPDATDRAPSSAAVSIAFVDSFCPSFDESCVGGNIGVSGIDGSHMHLLPIEGRAPSFSPDGATVVFDRPGSACPSGCGDLYVAKLGGSHPTKIAANGRAAAWSPDGDQILFERKLATCVTGSTCSDIWTVKPDGSAPELWTRDARAPSWSPDGKHAAFVRVNNTAVVCSSEIWITDDPDGIDSFTRIVTSAATQALSVAWSPDSERLAVARHDSKRCQRGDKSEYGLWTMGRDGSAPERITTAAVKAAWLDGNRLAFERVNCTPTFCPPPDLFTIRTDGSRLERIRASTAWPALT